MNAIHVTSQAVPQVEQNCAKSATIPELIAYLSLCMLAASFGAMIGPLWSHWWAIFGTFGLASALGLDVVNRSRARLAAESHRKQLAREAERKLDEVMGDMQSTSAVRAALRQFQSGTTAAAPRGANGQGGPRLPLNKPARITRLLQYSGGVVQRMGDPLPGRVRNVSRQGFGLAHDERLDRGLVLLEIDLENGEPLQLVGGVLWCELQDNGCYFSGGKVLEVRAAGKAGLL